MVLQECPRCHQKQATKNKVCKCGENLDKAKRSKRVKYWISYYLPGKKQKREVVGYSIEEARDAHAKRRSQKRELGDQFFRVFREEIITFSELTEWYLNLESVKRLSSRARYSISLNNFNKVLGDRLIRDIRAIDLEDYQAKRVAENIAPKTIDEEIAAAHRMVRKADDNDMIDPHVLKPFKRTEKLIRRGENARERVLPIKEYLSLLHEATDHLKDILKVAMNTGMRHLEILTLKWSYIDRKKWMIRLPAEVTKEGKPKRIPINKTVREVFEAQPRALHHDYVFTYKGEPFKGYVRKAVIGACKRARIPYGRSVEGGFIFQDIRRTVKTNMLRAGVDKALRDIILGHSLEGMDVHYLKPSDGDLHAAMKKYSSWLESEIESSDQSSDQEVM